MLVKDSKLSFGSTESRNWPFGDSNLKSMVVWCKDEVKVVAEDVDLENSKSSKCWSILGGGDSVIPPELELEASRQSSLGKRGKVPSC